MKKIFFIVSFLIFFCSFSYGKTQKEEYLNDTLYSQEYFDYLIESSQENLNQELEKKEAEEIILEENNIDISEANEDTEQIFSDGIVPFRLKIQEDLKISPYGEQYKKDNTKTTIMLGENFGLVQDMQQWLNSYNTNDYRVLTGFEYSPLKHLTLSMGAETNYRGLQQNPTSRKLYFTPSISLTDKLSLTFHNKYNIVDRTTNNDVGFKLSPLSNKSLDFSVYASSTRKATGANSQSLNLRTNFYFF